MPSRSAPMMSEYECRDRPGVPKRRGAPGPGVLVEVHSERMAGMGLVTGTRALEFRSSQWRSVAAHHSGPENVDV
jgi:hypothetical protein